MSYQVLARKWRPQVFADVVGQSHITKTLQNAIASGRLAHAFLFSGPRGVGKTTTARILAKALNCAEGPTPTPCGTCSSCRETAAGTSVDVVEIDGASNRGIDHIRELRETVKYAAAGGKHKVYVIDEVHMLTNEAFNALLKTLEEPPPHVVFIFATTEPQKIPATIHSRCQHYGFKRIAPGDTIAKLRDIAAQEGISISDQGLGMIARAAEGSMRDSQSLLDQAISYSGLAVRDEDLQVILGAVPQELLASFVGELLARDAASLLRRIDALLEQGQDMRQFLAGVIEHVRNLLVAKNAADPARLIELPAADVETVRQQAGTAESGQLLMLFDSLSRTFDEMRWSHHQRYTLEVGLIKACSLEPLQPLTEVLERLNELGGRLESGGSPANPAPAGVRERSAPYARPAGAPQAASRAAAVPAGGHGDAWSRVIHLIREQKPSLAPVLEHSRLLESGPEGMVVGIAGSSFQMDQVERKDNRSVIETAVASVFGPDTRITFRAVAGHAPPQRPVPAGKKKESRPPANDPLVQDALKIFGGEVVEQDDPESE